MSVLAEGNEPEWNALTSSTPLPFPPALGDATPQPAAADEGEASVYIAAAVFSLCYFLVGILCCRCYWIHLKKKSENNRSCENNLETAGTQLQHQHQQEETSREPSDALEINTEDNEFLEAKCC
ncbi:uncharacterized protein LOC119594416 [Penaeus monodon]|uniref:uncharacterized protein LOC119594416 n=1 Tax=Penaeus monodon TaxID=6687 RepID=UPI0018A6FEE1|nr:uncharacterized protein LOC119594416 [Penaeus monodon]